MVPTDGYSGEQQGTVMSQRRWRLRPLTDATPIPGFPPLIQRLLANRGVRSALDAERFLNVTATHDPMALPDADIAVSRLRRAIQDSELIAVFGDFDVDGITATAILSEGLRRLGGQVIPYIPDRFKEGYGLSVGAVKFLHDQGARVLVTADCGTSNHGEIAEARALGLDVIVVDHHAVPPQQPEATALLNPKRPESTYPFSDLSSGGLAYKLLLALGETLGRSELADAYLDLAALSTVCDLAPLIDENRTIVQRGLRRLQQGERVGLQALCRAAGVDGSRIDAEAIGFALGPRINAAGRIAHGRIGLELLLTRDPVVAERLAAELNALNQQRQQQTAAAIELAQALLTPEDTASPLIMVGHPEIPAGIVGLVASRLADIYYRPAIVYEEGPYTSRASCRSIPEFNIIAALRSCGDLFTKYGGHHQAAGFTAETALLPVIRERLLERAKAELQNVELVPVIEIDAVVPLQQIRGEEIRWLGRFAPCGVGNPEPVLLSTGVTALECWPVGEGGRHLRLKLRDGPVVWPAIAFDQELSHFEPGSRLDLVYTLSRDRSRPDGLQLQVHDFRPSD